MIQFRLLTANRVHINLLSLLKRLLKISLIEGWISDIISWRKVNNNYHHKYLANIVELLRFYYNFIYGIVTTQANVAIVGPPSWAWNSDFFYCITYLFEENIIY